MFLGDRDVDQDGVVLGILVIEVAVVPRTGVLHLLGRVCGLRLNRWQQHRRCQWLRRCCRCGPAAASPETIA
jgi:hypothetical protein